MCRFESQLWHISRISIYISVIEVASHQYGAEVVEQLAESVSEGKCEELEKEASGDNILEGSSKLMLPNAYVRYHLLVARHFY